VACGAFQNQVHGEDPSRYPCQHNSPIASCRLGQKGSWGPQGQGWCEWCSSSACQQNSPTAVMLIGSGRVEGAKRRGGTSPVCVTVRCQHLKPVLFTHAHQAIPLSTSHVPVPQHVPTHSSHGVLPSTCIRDLRSWPACRLLHGLFTPPAVQAFALVMPQSLRRCD
jgi:hypothetical protein